MGCTHATPHRVASNQKHGSWNILTLLFLKICSAMLDQRAQGVSPPNVKGMCGHTRSKNANPRVTKQLNPNGPTFHKNKAQYICNPISTDNFKSPAQKQNPSQSSVLEPPPLHYLPSHTQLLPLPSPTQLLKQNYNSICLIPSLTIAT